MPSPRWGAGSRGTVQQTWDGEKGVGGQGQLGQDPVPLNPCVPQVLHAGGGPPGPRPEPELHAGCPNLRAHHREGEGYLLPRNQESSPELGAVVPRKNTGVLGSQELEC